MVEIYKEKENFQIKQEFKQNYVKKWRLWLEVNILRILIFLVKIKTNKSLTDFNSILCK